MDVISIILGAIGSAILGFFISYSLQRLSYKDEYYKTIIQKRLIAYSDIEKVVGELRHQKFSSVEPFQAEYHKIFDTWDDFGNFYIQLLEIGNNAYWLNNDTDYKFMELQNYLRTNFHSLIPLEDSQALGKLHYYHVELLASQLQYLLFRDMKKLHKVSHFLKSKTPSSVILSMTEDDMKE